MSRRGICATVAGGGAAVMSVVALAGGDPPCKPHPSSNSSTLCCQTGGPDVIVGSLPERANYSSIGDLYDAFSFGTTSCNVGDTNLSWIDENDSNLHPVIAQNMYRLKNGRFEHVGLSWLKHGFFALQGNACGCGCINSGNGNLALGIGCSDPYDAFRNGDQGSLGPRWQVNPHTGVFSSPHDNPPITPGSATERRLRVKKTDLEPSSTTVRYFVEGHYVTQDDAAAGNQNNNASYRQIAITQSGSEFSVSSSFPGATQREQPGIRAWQDTDPLVTETDVQVEGDGLFIVAAKATDLGGGIWHYEYAVQNLNSERAGASFSVPRPEGVKLTNIGFHDVEYHAFDGIPSGTPRTFDGTDWTVTESTDSITWTTVQTFTEEPNANALRWGTLYNFRFDANIAPGSGEVTLGLFKPGTPSTVSATTVIPAASCPADIFGGDGVVDVNDLMILIGAWGSAGGPADINDDNIVDVNDLLMLIGGWGPC